MRIAVITGSEELIGGAETYVRWLLGALGASGHEVAFAFERAARDRSKAITQGGYEAGWWDISQLGRATLTAELSRFRPDVVFVHGLEDYALECELLSRHRTVLFAHAYWGVCLTGFRTHAWPERKVCERRFGAACLAIDYARGCGSLHPRRTLRQYAVQRYRQRHLPYAAAVVVASQHMRRTYQQHGVPDEKIRVIPCPPGGVEPAPEPPRERPFSDQLLFIGRFTEVKGASHAIRATALASSILGRRLRLVAAGSGPRVDECRSVARAVGADVELLGWVDGERRLALFEQSDLLVVPSLWPEPFGMVGVEGACVGLPSAGYDVGGIRDWLLPGVTGELARPFDVGELASAITRALGDPAHHHKLRLGAWTRARSATSDAHLSALMSLFAEVAAASVTSSVESGRPRV